MPTRFYFKHMSVAVLEIFYYNGSRNKNQIYANSKDKLLLRFVGRKYIIVIAFTFYEEALLLKLGDA